MISNIIPTHKRPKTLKKHLDWLLQQSFRDLEVIVVSDLFCNETASIVLKARLQASFRIYYVDMFHSGCGVTSSRNEGVLQSRGDKLVFTDDDIFPPANFFERMDEYIRPGVAIVTTTFDRPELEPRLPFYAFGAHSGICTADMITFDEAMIHYGLEDSDCGLRLWAKGIAFEFHPELTCVHYDVEETIPLDVKQEHVKVNSQYLEEKYRCLGLVNPIHGGYGFYPAPMDFIEDV